MIASRNWAWFRSMRWGRNAPGAVLWWLCSPLGQYVVIDELKFQHADPSEVSALIREHDKELRMADPPRYLAAESRLWDIDRGPTVAELFARSGMAMSKTSSDLVQGWNQLSSLMKQIVTDPARPDALPTPALVVANNCGQLKRMIPLLREGKTNKEDIDNATEACFVHALRIGIMSRPTPTSVAPRTPQPGTMGHALQQARELAEFGPQDSQPF